MTNDDIDSAFRITAEYCRTVNPARLSQEDVCMLNRGEIWLRNLLIELGKAVDQRPFDVTVVDKPPDDSGISGPAKVALDRFVDTSNQAHRFTTTTLLESPDVTLPIGGGKTSYLDLAKHMARISNLTSVDQHWVWG